MKNRGILIAGNWKMNHGPAATEKFFKDLKAAAADQVSIARPLFASGRLQAWVAAPAVSFHKAVELSNSAGFPVQIAAQNGHWEKSGAFTGELSATLMQEVSVTRALVGHSERRQHFGETDETVRKRTEGLMAQGVQVVLCIGETRAERESGKTAEVLERQLSAVFPAAGVYLDGRLVIAYEPVWAIGTGLTATPQQAEEAHQVVRAFLKQRCGAAAADKTPILYGGSVTPDNVDVLLGCANVDGALVGGASLKAESYWALVSAGIRILQS